jgi:hypothetical protein
MPSQEITTALAILHKSHAEVMASVTSTVECARDVRLIVGGTHMNKLSLVESMAHRKACRKFIDEMVGTIKELGAIANNSVKIATELAKLCDDLQHTHKGT